MADVAPTFVRSNSMSYKLSPYKMSKIEAINRYSLIVNKLRQVPATFTEISEYLSQETDWQGYNYQISKRTFQRDLEDIRTLYDIDIQYNFSTMLYHIEAEEHSDYKVRLLEAYDTLSVLNLHERLSKNIQLEHVKAKGTKFLQPLLKAIDSKSVVTFDYYKFSERGVSQRQVHPYLIKEYRSRWYLLAIDCKDKVMKSFAIDRIRELTLEPTNFSPLAGFDPTEYYHNCFGIIRPARDKPISITLSFETYQGEYIKTLPLHHSQEIIIDNEDELRIKLHLNITEDFIMELMSYGESMEVIQPKRLKNRITESALNMLNYYK